MADLIGTSDTTNFGVTTNTYAASSGECFYAMTANQSGMVDTLKLRMNAFNTSTQIALRVRDSSGNLLASGNIAPPKITEGNSVSVAPFPVVQGETYYMGIVANTGSPNAFQSATTGIRNQTTSTFAEPAPQLTLPGNLLSAVRRFHIWAEGTASTSPKLTITGDAIPGQSKTWTTENFSPAVNAGTLDDVSLTGVSATGFNVPPYVDGGRIVLPGSRSITATNGTQSDTKTVNVGVIPGYTYTVLEPGFDEGNYSVVQGAGASAGWVVIHPEGDNVGPNALLETNVEGSRTYWLGDPVSGLGYSYLVTTGADGSVTVSRSLTSVGITGSGIAGRGIIGVGI